MEESSAGWQSPYYFNAKELDNETGLYYYGARYLDPTEARWMSVDPMWEKYTDANPYNYCHGNPITMVDPDGRDEYEVNPQGYVSRVKECEKHTLYAIGNDGKRTGSEINVRNKSILDDLTKNRNDYKGTDAKGKNIKSGHYSFSKAKESMKIFTFLSDVSSEAEWDLTKYKDGFYGLFTTHQRDAVSEYKGHYGLTDIEFDIHSHPGYGFEGTKGGSGYGVLSTGDHLFINRRWNNWYYKYIHNIDKQSEFPCHFVYHRKSKTLYQYTPWVSDFNLGKVMNLDISLNIKNKVYSLKTEK
ncbi:MAG: RHS repeat-associated core domain-containing protein [Paludibacteraceae bacterium]|nr:RHS repeat-associated core domain-containing protein [Paludibacteraceae bacterium]